MSCPLSVITSLQTPSLISKSPLSHLSFLLLDLVVQTSISNLQLPVLSLPRNKKQRPVMAPSPTSHRSSRPSIFQALLSPPISSLLPRTLVPRSASLPGSAIVGIVLSAITFLIICIAAVLYYRQRRHVSIGSQGLPKPRPHSHLSFRCATRVTPTNSVFPEVAERKISNPIPFSASSSPPTNNDSLPLNPWNGQVAWPIKTVSLQQASIAHPVTRYPSPAHSRDHLLHDARPVPQMGTTVIMRRDQWGQRDQDKTSLWFQPRHLERGRNETHV